jgi:hypothetical protein
MVRWCGYWKNAWARSIHFYALSLNCTEGITKQTQSDEDGWSLGTAQKQVLPKCSVTDQHTWCGRTEYLLSSFKSVIMKVHQWYAIFPMTDYSPTFLPLMWITFQNSAGMFTPYLEQMSIPMQSHWFDYYYYYYYNNIQKLY